jgi:hypothetical protein
MRAAHLPSALRAPEAPPGWPTTSARANSIGSRPGACRDWCGCSQTGGLRSARRRDCPMTRRILPEI